jgi:hypothetical protein
MSIRGQILVRGVDCALRRAAPVATDTGQRDAWSAVGTVRLLLEPITAELAAHVFGSEARVTLRGYATAAAGALAVQPGDGGVVPVDAPFAGRYRVRGLVPAGHARPGAHQELGLVSTPEAMEPMEVSP